MRTKNIYFTGDICCNKDSAGTDRMHACFTISRARTVSRTRTVSRLLFAETEDMERLETVSNVYDRWNSYGISDTSAYVVRDDAYSYADYVENVFKGYMRPCDIIFLNGNMCFYHIWGSHLLVLLRRRNRHIMLRQDNWFMSGRVPFWNMIRLRPGDILLYGDRLDIDEDMLRYAYDISHTNLLFRNIHMRYKSPREILDIIGHGKSNIMLLINICMRR